MGWWVGGGLLDYIVSPSPIPFPLDFRFWILDLDFGLDLGLTILSNFRPFENMFYYEGVPNKRPVRSMFKGQLRC